MKTKAINGGRRVDGRSEVYSVEGKMFFKA